MADESLLEYATVQVLVEQNYVEWYTRTLPNMHSEDGRAAWLFFLGEHKAALILAVDTLALIMEDINGNTTNASGLQGTPVAL